MHIYTFMKHGDSKDDDFSHCCFLTFFGLLVSSSAVPAQIRGRMHSFAQPDMRSETPVALRRLLCIRFVLT